jgi:ACS family glucarate transporter-like MFS transporter
LFKNRNVFLLSVSYFCYGYVFYIFVFWLFLYLTDVRGFTILEGGFFTSLPFIVGGIAAPVGGYITDRLSIRIGRRWGRRWMGLAGMTLSGIALLVGANTTHIGLAIVALSLCFGFGELTEGAYWSSIVDVSGPYAGSASGVMNMWTNLGGVICTPLVPFLVERFGWPFALGSAAAISWLAALLWLGIRSDEVFEG